MAKTSNKTSKKGRKSSKKELKKNVIKAVDTVLPVSTPIGSVHFDEFLKICLQPNKLPIAPIEPVKKGGKAGSKKGGKKDKKKSGKKGNKKGKGKKSEIKKVVVQPDIPEKTSFPTLFPLVKVLLQLTDGDILEENALFSVCHLIISYVTMKYYKFNVLYRNLFLVKHNCPF